MCGDGLPEDTQLVVRRALTCSSPVETTYYSSPVYLPPVCVHCGSADDLLDDYHEYIVKMHEKFSTVRPLCSPCHIQGKEAATWGKKFFKKQKT